MNKKRLSLLASGTALMIAAAFGVSACKKPAQSEKDRYVIDGSTVTVNRAGPIKYEAEKVDTEHYLISDGNPSVIVERADASGGKFLAAAKEVSDVNGSNYFSFTLNLQFNAEITMSAAYAQTESDKTNAVDMRDSYNYLIDENKSLGLTENDFILAPRGDITQWDTVIYDTFTLPAGTHSFRVFAAKNTGNGNPNIDYFQFDISGADSSEVGGISVPANDFHTPNQYAYICDSYENISAYAKGVIELSRPNAIILDYSDLADSTSYAVEYADNEKFTGSTVVEGIEAKQYGIYNLELGQKLYWRAAAKKSALKKAQTRSLTVASEGPRNLYIDGVTNARDVGGYASSLAEGAKIRQGLYFRGADLESVTEAGKTEMLRLGIKTEIDLRDENQCKGPYVDGIEYNAISIPSGTESTRFEKFADEYKRIFTIIANADNSPVYLHCTAGADRTGICTFILLTLCGVSYEDAARDYLFTNFSTQGVRKLESEFAKWYDKLDTFEGETKADKAKSWLISKGVTAEQAEHIREIFVEGYTAR